MKNTVGEKLKLFRSNFGMSHSQISKMLGTVSHSTYGSWEKSGAPVDRLAEVAKLTVDPKKTFDWLTSTKGSKMPVLQLVNEIPAGGGPKTRAPKRSKKKKKSKGKKTRRAFTDQDRANIMADMDARIRAGSDTIGSYCKRHDLGTSMSARWRKLKLPKANGAGAPNIVTKTDSGSVAPPANRPVDKAGRRSFTHQDRANILADLARHKLQGDTIATYCERFGLGTSMTARWAKFKLPKPNHEAVPGIVEQQGPSVPIDKAGRRVFSDQDRANILADLQLRRATEQGLTFNDYCKEVGVVHSVVRRWTTMDLPDPDGAEVPGVIGGNMPPAQSAADFTNLPTVPIEPKKPGPKPGTPQHAGHGGYRSKIPKPKALITSQYQCPHCGHPVFLPEE